MSGDYQTEKRMSAKLKAIPLPDLKGKSVLDVGCDHAFWSWMAADRGASKVVGLDRGRDVKNVGFTDLVALNNDLKESNDIYRKVCSFHAINLGRHWFEYGRFDVVFMFSLYHHVFQNVGDHAPIWYWLWRHTAPGGQVLWENPVDTTDSVVQRNVSLDKHHLYTREQILAAASVWFLGERIGPALHEPTREVWRFTPRPAKERTWVATLRDGAGGATKAFEYQNGCRMGEVENVLGRRPIPGSLNLVLNADFDWNRGYYVAPILDVANRKDPKGLDQAWVTRPARFYPVAVNGVDAVAFRFDGEGYKADFVELLALVRLRDHIGGNQVTLCALR